MRETSRESMFECMRRTKGRVDYYICLLKKVTKNESVGRHYNAEMKAVEKIKLQHSLESRKTQLLWD